MYSDFMKLLKNLNVLRTLTRSTFTHTQNITISTFHSLVKVWSMFLQNTHQTLTRQWNWNLYTFDDCQHVALALVLKAFAEFVENQSKTSNSKHCFKPLPESHLRCARVNVLFEMLLWLDTFFCENLTPTRGFWLRHSIKPMENYQKYTPHSYTLAMFVNLSYVGISQLH